MTYVVASAQEYLVAKGLDGWLLYDYHHVNPIFWQVAGEASMVTRPCLLFIPPRGEPTLLAHQVDVGRFRSWRGQQQVFTSRDEMVKHLRSLLTDVQQVAMEYSPQGALPRVSRVDAGTVELVRSLGVEVVSSADLFQYATQRWSPQQLELHRSAARKLGDIVQEAFRFIGQRLPSNPSEYHVQQFILERFEAEGLVSDEPPIVAVNQNGADPHYQPTAKGASLIRPGDWVLIDLWAREKAPDAVYADITWVGFCGRSVPSKHLEVFRIVVGARDAAIRRVREAKGQRLQGWQVDRVARDYIAGAGYGPYFTHRLGHSLGLEVHGDAVNLDDLETHDTREIIPGIGFTIEPGIYLPGEFGMRSEIDLYMSEEGVEVTTAVQREVVLIGEGV